MTMLKSFFVALERYIGATAASEATESCVPEWSERSVLIGKQASLIMQELCHIKNKSFCFCGHMLVVEKEEKE